jgi:hypothetical protein
VPALSAAAVESRIVYLPLIRAARAQEANAYTREQTLKAMLPVAPKLSQRTLNQTLLKHLARLQACLPLFTAIHLRPCPAAPPC